MNPMSKPAAHHPERHRRDTFLRLAKMVIERVYAVAIIGVTAWLSYMAIRYLVVTLMFPTTSPGQIIGIPTRMTGEVLQTRREQWAGVGASENPRGPLAHYHRIGGWVQPDNFNSCTQSGCHPPLPHSKRKEVRAFLNMHATSLQCGVCHQKSDASPLTMTWYDLETGQPREAPSALQAYELVTSAEGRKELEQGSPEAQARLVRLLESAANESEGVTTLRGLARHVEAVRSTSETFQQLVNSVRTILPAHFRGEYGAKLALRDPQTGRPILGHPETADAVREYIEHGAGLKPGDREPLLARIHPSRRPQAVHCTDCHRDTGSLVDFAKMGYPSPRREALVRKPVFQMIEHIGAGQPMNLPSFFTTPTEQPGPTPTSQPPQPSTQP
jgi:hypothetical protein